MSDQRCPACGQAPHAGALADMAVRTALADLAAAHAALAEIEKMADAALRKSADSAPVPVNFTGYLRAVLEEIAEHARAARGDGSP